MRKIALVILVGMMALAGICFAGSGTYAGGDGTISVPWQIATTTQYVSLVTHSDDWNNYFVLTADLDFAAAGAIDPIGVFGTEWTGTFDGQNHTISNITVHVATGDAAACPDSYNGNAMFIRAASGSVIKNLNIVGAVIDGVTDVNDKQSYCAVLVAENANGAIISNCNINGTLTHVHSSTDTATIDLYALVGMVAGVNHGIVSHCTSSGSIDFQITTAGTIAYAAIGGLVGQQTGLSGGSVGYTTGSSTVTITSNSSILAITTYVGGICGYVCKTGTNANYLLDCHYVGTLNVASTRGAATNDYFNAGGIVGYANSLVSRCYSTGTLTASSTTTTASGFAVGGLAGKVGLVGTVSQSWTAMAVRVNYATVGLVGGAIGWISGASGTVNDCYSIGSLYDLKQNSTALKIPRAGGFVGFNWDGTLARCYCAMSPYTVGSGATGIAGFGSHYKNAVGAGGTALFYDSTLNNIADIVIVAGDVAIAKTTAQMKTRSTFTGWDFGTLWRIDTGGLFGYGSVFKSVTNNGYPYLYYQGGKSTPFGSGGSIFGN
jgi:hypothetical protein